MGIGILPGAVLVALGILALAAWAFFRARKGNRGGYCVSTPHVIVLLACCIALWSGSCFVFMVWASLGHSAHPLRDSWPQCAVSFFVLIIAPLTLFIWHGRRRSKKDKKSF